MVPKAKRIDVATLSDASAWLALLHEVHEKKDSLLLHEDGEDLALLTPPRSSGGQLRGRPMTAADPLSRMVGSVTDAPAADAARKLRGESTPPKRQTDPGGDVAAPVGNVPDADDKAPWSSARSLRRFVGAWVGDDLQERLAEVYATRGEMRE